MHLVSDHIVEGGAGPTYDHIYPTLAGVDLTDIRAFTRGQPWADFARMRAEAPVMWHPMPRGGVGFWAATSFEGVKRINGDPKTFSSETGGILMALGPQETRHPTLFSASTNSMINLDGRPHREMRRERRKKDFIAATVLTMAGAAALATLDMRAAGWASVRQPVMANVDTNWSRPRTKPTLMLPTSLMDIKPCA